jgi:cobalt-precorrin-5B (C1)-methyltransferase
VSLLPDQPDHIHITGGSGVGVVTMPGLGLTVGLSAINPVPRRNIEANVRIAAASLLDDVGLSITISVPDGELMAKKTTNARLGILGGISILGTTGIVKPYSTAAYRASVVQGVQVAGTLPHGIVVLTTGGRTEKFVMDEFPHLPEAAFVQMGDFLRYAMSAAVKAGLKQVVIGGMVGKLTKIAQGETITHAGRADVNTGLLADVAAELNAPSDVCEAIRNAKTARYAGERMDELGLGAAFHTALAQRVIQTLRARYPDSFDLKVLVCDFDGCKIAEASS